MEIDDKIREATRIYLRQFNSKKELEKEYKKLSLEITNSTIFQEEYQKRILELSVIENYLSGDI